MSEPTKIYAVQYENGRVETLWSTLDKANQRIAHINENWPADEVKPFIVARFLDEEIFLGVSQPTIESRQQSAEEFNAWRSREIAKAESAPYDPASNRLEALKLSAWSAGIVLSLDKWAEQWKSGKLTVHKS